MSKSSYITFRKKIFYYDIFLLPKESISFQKFQLLLEQANCEEPIDLQIFLLPPHPAASLSSKPDDGCSAKIAVHSWHDNSLAWTAPQLSFNRPYNKFIDTGRQVFSISIERGKIIIIVFSKSF